MSIKRFSLVRPVINKRLDSVGNLMRYLKSFFKFIRIHLVTLSPN